MGLISSILTLTWITETSLGFVGNRVDESLVSKLNTIKKTVQDYFSETEIPLNNDLQKAIERSHWLATKVFCEELKKQNKPADILNRIIEVANEQIKSINNRGYKQNQFDISSSDIESIILGEEQNINDLLKRKVIDFHIKDLEHLLKERETDHLSFNNFEQNIRNGLDNLDWFSLACSFLNDSLTGDNNKAKDALHNYYLAKISKNGGENQQLLMSITSTMNGFVDSIGKERFEEFKAFLKEDLAEIKGYLIRIEDRVISIQGKVDKLLEGENIPKTPKELTLKIPKIHPSEVIGRETELTDLHKLLFANKQVVVVNGLGGIGKTTLAQAYLSQYYDDYEHIAWISQSAENTIINDFVNAEGLKESLNISVTTDDLQQIFNEILKSLKALPTKPNLLLIDNAESNLSQLVDYLPHQPNWHLLVTSRENIERFYMKELGFLTPEKALELFRTHCKLIQDENDINDLLKTIDYHTLTIEILAKTAQKQHTNITKLKTAIETDLRAGVYIKHKGKKIEKVFSYLTSIFDLSRLNMLESWLMKQFACLPAEFLTYEQLHELISPEGEYEESFAETLAELVAKGWILTNIEADSYKMHRIIAEVAAQKLSVVVADIENLIANITKKLSIDQTKDNPIDKFQWIPYGRAILINFEHETDVKISAMQNNLALVLQDLGDYQGAKELLEKAKNSDEKSFGEEHPTTAVRYSNLALVLQSLGDYEVAKSLLEKAKNSDEKNFGEEYPIMVSRYSNLGVLLKDLGDFEGAKHFLEKAKILDERNYGGEHPIMIIRYSNLAMVLKDLGNYEGAKKLLEKAKNSAEKNFGEEHPSTAKTYSNLALALIDLGDFEGAKRLLEKAKNSDEKNYGEEHPSTTRTYSNLALSLKSLGDYIGAKKWLEKAKHLAEKKFGEEHPNTSIIYSNLAATLQSLGDYQGAKELLEKAKNSDEKKFGEEHPNTVRTYSNLGMVLKDLGDFEGAKELLEKAKNSNEKNFGKKHPTTAVSYSNLALVLYNLKDFNNAIILLEKAYKVYRNHSGEQHSTSKTIKANLDFVRQQMK